MGHVWHRTATPCWSRVEVPRSRSQRAPAIRRGRPGTLRHRLSKTDSRRHSSSSSRIRLLFLPMESPSSFRIPAREQSVFQAETEAQSDMVTPIRMPIPAREMAYRKVWRSNSILLKTHGILNPLTGPSAMWRFRAAVPAQIRRIIAFYAQARVVQTRLWAAPSLLQTWRTAQSTA